MNRKKLSITQRLTLTSMVLTGAVLVPAVLLVELAAKRSIEAEAAAFALQAAERTLDEVLAQWDEEYLVEFGAESITFRDLKVGLENWALSRPNGAVECAAGAFALGLPSLVGAATQLHQAPGGKLLRSASLPLLVPAAVRFDDLPASVRDRVRPLGRWEQCVSIRRETAGNGFAFEVKMLGSGAIHAVKIAPNGSVVRQSRETLPASLPADLLQLLQARGDEVTPGAVEWRQHQGQLLAVVTISKPNQAGVRVGVNRIGERFRLQAGTEEFTADEESRLYLTAAVDATIELQTLESLQLRLWIGGGLVWGLLSLAGWFVARRAMQPVQRMVDSAAAINVDRLSARLPVGGADDELARIAVTINGTLDRLEAGYRRERNLTSDIAHELRTPLAKTIGELDLSLTRARAAEEYHETVVRCRGYAHGMERLVEALLLLARLESGGGKLEKSVVDLGSMAAETISLLPAADRDRVDLTLHESAAPILAWGEPHLLRTLLRNLLENAARYSPPDSRIDVEVAANGARVVKMQVLDRGAGIPVASQERVFDRFYRLDTSRSRHEGGLGLGLAIVRAIVQAHEGKVELTTGPSGGTLAQVTLSAGSESQSGSQRNEN